MRLSIATFADGGSLVPRPPPFFCYHMMRQEMDVWEGRGGGGGGNYKFVCNKPESRYLACEVEYSDLVNVWEGHG